MTEYFNLVLCDTVEIKGKKYSSKPPLYSLVTSSQALFIYKLLKLDMDAYDKIYVGFLVLINQIIPFFVLALRAILNILKDTKMGRLITYFLLMMSCDAPFCAMTYDGYQIKPYSWNIFRHLGKITHNPDNLSKIKYKRYFVEEVTDPN